MYLISWLWLSFGSLTESINFKFNKKKVMFSITTIFLILVTGLRYRIGRDYQAYENIFKNLDNLNEFKNMEIGFRFFVIFFKNIGLNYYSLFFIFSVFGLAFIHYGIKKNSYYPMFSYFIFFNTVYPSYFLSGIRQGISMSIFLYLINDMYNKRLLKVIIFSVLAGLIHKSGFFIIVAYFIPRKKIFKKIDLIIFVLISIIIFMHNPFRNFFLNILPSSVNQVIINYSNAFKNDVSILKISQRVLILFPFIFFKDKLDKKIKNFNYVFNMYLFGYFLYILFSFQIDFATRLNQFFRILEIIMFPMLIKITRDRLSKFIFWLFISTWATLLLLSLLRYSVYFPYKFIF